MAEEQYTELQNKLKSILQICLETVKPRLKSKQQMAELQDLLIDYQNNQQLADIIENVLKMNQKLQLKLASAQENKNMVDEDQYKKLQQSLMTLQARERAYIKNQYQLKLYCQQLQIKVKQLQNSKNQLVISTKKVILDLKRDNQDLISKLKNHTPYNSLPNDKINQSGKNQSFHKQNGHSIEKLQKLPKNVRGQKFQSSLKSKLQQYHEVISSIEAGRGRKILPPSELKMKERIAGL